MSLNNIQIPAELTAADLEIITQTAALFTDGTPLYIQKSERFRNAYDFVLSEADATVTVSVNITSNRRGCPLEMMTRL